MSKAEKTRRSSCISGKSILRLNPKVEHASVPVLPSVNGSSTSKRSRSRYASDDAVHKKFYNPQTSGRSRTKSIITHKFPSETAKKQNYLDAFSCECGPDLYNTILGPTADEAILSGISMIKNVFQKFMVCDAEEEEEEEMVNLSRSESIIKDSSTKSAPTIISEILESIGLSPELASAIVQTSIMELSQKHPSMASKLLQTSTPEMISQILQTIGFPPEMASKIIQTSYMYMEEQDPEMASKIIQTSFVSMDEEEPEEPTSSHSIEMREPSGRRSSVGVREPSQTSSPSHRSSIDAREPSRTSSPSHRSSLDVREPSRTSSPSYSSAVDNREPSRTSTPSRRSSIDAKEPSRTSSPCHKSSIEVGESVATSTPCRAPCAQGTGLEVREPSRPLSYISESPEFDYVSQKSELSEPEETKMCICCKCKNAKDTQSVATRQSSDNPPEVPPEEPKKIDRCVCCECPEDETQSVTKQSNDPPAEEPSKGASSGDDRSSTKSQTCELPQEAPKKSKMCVCCKCSRVKEVKKCVKEKKPKMCVCCKCSTPTTECKPLKETVSKKKMCVCCKCFVEEKDMEEHLASHRKESCCSEVPQGVIRKQRICICCKSTVTDEQACDFRSGSVAERIKEQEHRIRSESPFKLTICKCLEYTGALMFGKNRNAQEVRTCGKSRSKCTCTPILRRQKSHIHDKGDIYSLIDTDIGCCCDDRKSYKHSTGV